MHYYHKVNICILELSFSKSLPLDICNILVAHYDSKRTDKKMADIVIRMEVGVRK